MTSQVLTPTRLLARMPLWSLDTWKLNGKYFSSNSLPTYTKMEFIPAHTSRHNDKIFLNLHNIYSWICTRILFQNQSRRVFQLHKVGPTEPEVCCTLFPSHWAWWHHGLCRCLGFESRWRQFEFGILSSLGLLSCEEAQESTVPEKRWQFHYFPLFLCIQWLLVEKNGLFSMGPNTKISLNIPCAKKVFQHF